MTTTARPSQPNWRWRGAPVEPGPAASERTPSRSNTTAGRQHFLDGGAGGRKDWDGFFEACGDDPLIEEVGRLLSLLDPKLQVLLLTGRPLRVQAQTLSWLDRYQLRWDLLVMRDFGDYTAATEFKRLTVGQFRRVGFDLRLAFEDDRRNLEMFRAEGVPCVYIHSGYFDD